MISPHIDLKRISYRSDGTFGVLLFTKDLFTDKLPFAVTLERPWLNNTIGKSCIPTGDYICKRVMSPKFGNTFQVMDVPGRSHILFHKGNIDDDTEGCILIGEEYSIWDDGSVSIGRSGHAYTEFMDLLATVEEFGFRISNC